jgi:hypothetical protein
MLAPVSTVEANTRTPTASLDDVFTDALLSVKRERPGET